MQVCRSKIFVSMIEGKLSRAQVVDAVFRSGIKAPVHILYPGGWGSF